MIVRTLAFSFLAASAALAQTTIIHVDNLVISNASISATGGTFGAGSDTWSLVSNATLGRIGALESAMPTSGVPSIPTNPSSMYGLTTYGGTNRPYWRQLYETYGAGLTTVWTHTTNFYGGVVQTQQWIIPEGVVEILIQGVGGGGAGSAQAAGAAAGYGQTVEPVSGGNTVTMWVACGGTTNTMGVYLNGLGGWPGGGNGGINSTAQLGGGGGGGYTIVWVDGRLVLACGGGGGAGYYAAGAGGGVSGGTASGTGSPQAGGGTQTAGGVGGGGGNNGTAGSAGQGGLGGNGSGYVAGGGGGGGYPFGGGGGGGITSGGLVGTGGGGGAGWINVTNRTAYYARAGWSSLDPRYDANYAGAGGAGGANKTGGQQGRVCIAYWYLP